VLQGFNLSLFSFGSSGSGKTSVIEGNNKDPGLIFLLSDSLFNLLEHKKYYTNVGDNTQIQNFYFGVRIRYVEIIDEEIVDLFGTSQFQEPLQVVMNEWEGASIPNCK